MQEEKPTTEQDLKKAQINKAVEINIVDGKVHVLTPLSPNACMQVLSLALFETSKELSKDIDKENKE